MGIFVMPFLQQVDKVSLQFSKSVAPLILKKSKRSGILSGCHLRKGAPGHGMKTVKHLNFSECACGLSAKNSISVIYLFFVLLIFY